MADAVMGPVIAILAGAILIAGSLISASVLAPWIRIILGIGGVATIMLGIIMLFGLAYKTSQKTG